MTPREVSCAHTTPGRKRRPIAFRAALLAVAWFGAGLAQAADPGGHYAFRSFGPDQGLRNQAVTALAQDRDGYLFVGTEDGLFRFDGQGFEEVGADGGLPNQSVTLLSAARGGPLWVATKKGLVAWRGVRRAADRPEVLLADREVLGVASTHDGTLLVSTATGTFEGKAPRLLPVRGVPDAPGAGWIAGDGRELLIGRRGWLYRRDASGRWSKRALPTRRALETPQSLVKDGAGRIWVRGRQMLLRYAGFDGAVSDLSDRLPGAAVQKGELLLDGGRIWAPTNQGNAYFDGDASGVLGSARGLPNEWATTVLRDREGSLWVGSEGVQQLQGRLLWTAHTRREGMPSDTVWGIRRDRAGTLWAATNRGVASASADGWRPLPGTAERSFYTFAEGPDGDFWIGGNSGSATTNMLLHRAPGSTRFEPVALSSAEGPSTINSLAYASDGALYVATLAHGLHRLVKNGGGYRSERVTLPGGRTDEQVNQLIADAKGRLWGAGMHGLVHFDGARWRRFGTHEGLRESELETVTVAGEAVWISYWNLHGLSRVKPTASGGLEVLNVLGPEALVSDTVYSAGFDSHGLWLGTAAGIKRWRGAVLEHFGRAAGLPGADAAANGFWADPNGDVWFGMANGLAHFDARQDRPVPTPPVTEIRTLQDGEGRMLAPAAQQVPWKARTLTFHFTALGFLDPGQVHRQVRLLGFEDAWRETTVSEARYTGLLPGTYRFQARAKYGSGHYGSAATRTVEVLPPWWLTWWFLILATASLIALGLLGVRWRTTRLRRRNAALETLIETRTHALREANIALEHASMVDPLTGLKNRRFLAIFMPEELARVRRQHGVPANGAPAEIGPNSDLCLLMVDLDHFKNVNDTHGHSAGDAVLRQVGEVLRSTFRESDVVIRWGGEEFLVIARNADRRSASRLAASVCETIAAHPFELAGGTVLHKTCSVGFTTFPMVATPLSGFGWEAALDLADECLYAAKRSGRNGWVGCRVADPGENDGAPPSTAAALQTSGWGDVETSFDAPLQWK